MEIYDPTCGSGGLLIKCELEMERGFSNPRPSGKGERGQECPRSVKALRTGVRDKGGRLRLFDRTVSALKHWKEEAKFSRIISIDGESAGASAKESLQNFFDEGEREPDSVVRNFRTTAPTAQLGRCVSA